jgi:DNA-binding XRE family transcriptional regulator
MNLSDKIKQILTDKAISPSIFADEIGVQRSSMSHILAGRNKPSLEMVQKIVKRFPELGLDWILDENDLPDLAAIPTPTAARKIVAPNANKEVARSRPATIVTPEKKVAKIIVFYTDGTFKEFNEA